MAKFLLNDANSSFVLSNISFYNLEIKEKIQRNYRETLLYGSLDPDLSFIFNKFKENKINYSKELNDSIIKNNKNNNNNNDKAFNLSENEKIYSKIEIENNCDSTKSNTIENKLSSRKEEDAAKIECSKSSNVVDLNKNKKCNVNKNEIKPNKIQSENRVLKRGFSLPSDSEKSLKETKLKRPATNLKEIENFKINRQFKQPNQIKLIPLCQEKSIPKHHNNKISTKMSTDSKVKSVSKINVINDYRENARKNIFKNLEKKLVNLNERKDEMVLNKITEYYENGLYQHLGENYEKYRKKIIAICSNILDINNDTFYKKLVNYEIKPDELARMETSAMASENKIKEREMEKEQNLKILLKKIAEDNQNNTKIIKKTHKGEIEIEVNSSSISYLEENSEPSKEKETTFVQKISPAPTLVTKMILDKSDNTLIDRTDSGLFSDEDLDEIRNQKPLNWSCQFKSEFSSSFINVTMLSASKCENSFAIKIRNDFFKENLDLSIGEFDYFKCKSDDLMVQLKHVTNKNDLVFVKLEKSNQTIRSFYSNLYNYLVKQQSSIKNLLCYARMNLNSEHSDFISKLYLLPLKNKNVSMDENLKNLFSIEVNRNTNLILGVFVSNKIKLKIIDSAEVTSLRLQMNTSLNGNIKTDNFELISKTLLENEINIYEFLVFFFKRIINNNLFSNLDFRRDLIFFFTKFDKLAVLTDEERIKLKDQFYEKLPDLIFIIVRSSPNNLINIESLHGILQTCEEEKLTQTNIAIRNDESENIIEKQLADSLFDSVNELNDIEMVSDDEFDFPGDLNKEKLEYKSDDDDSISYVSDDDIDIPIVNHEKNSKVHTVDEAQNFNSSEIIQQSQSNEKEKKDEDNFKDKIPLTPDQEKIFDFKIVEFEKNRINIPCPLIIPNRSVFLPEINKPDIRIVNLRRKIMKPLKRNCKNLIFAHLEKNIKIKTDLKTDFGGFLKRNSLRSKRFCNFNRKFCIN
jgi:hypothetical protein